MTRAPASLLATTATETQGAELLSPASREQAENRRKAGLLNDALKNVGRTRAKSASSEPTGGAVLWGSALTGSAASYGNILDGAGIRPVEKAATRRMHPVVARHPELEAGLLQDAFALFVERADKLPPLTPMDVTSTALAAHFGVTNEETSSALAALVARGLLDRRMDGALGVFVGYTLGVSV